MAVHVGNRWTGDPARTVQVQISAFSPARDATCSQSFQGHFFLPIVLTMVVRGWVARAQNSLPIGFVNMGKPFHFSESISLSMVEYESVPSTTDKAF